MIIIAINKAKPKKFVQYDINNSMFHINISKTLDGELRVWNQLHKSWILFKNGDYIAIENEDDMYPVDQQYFKEHYEIVGEAS